MKKLRVNSILEPDSRRILRPCEARAGHGAIGMLISFAVILIFLAIAVPFVIKLAKWLWGFVTS